MLAFNIVRQSTPEMRRAIHQRDVAFQKRFAMENYLQDQSSELAEHWVEAADAEYVRMKLCAGSLTMVMLYGC